MKKIAIVTWIGSLNYGTSLQSFALQYALENKGYRTNLLDLVYSKKNAKQKKGLLFPLRIVKRWFIDKKSNDKPSKMRRFHKDCQKIVSPSNAIELNRIVNETDVFVSGNDQIWNVVHRFDKNMFLSFAQNKKRISYSSSIGINSIPIEYQDEVKNLLSAYSHISVREQKAVDVLSELTKRNDIVQVVDPTFLLTKDEWSHLCKDSRTPSSIKYLLCYFIGENDFYSKQVDDIRKKMQFDSVVVVVHRLPLKVHIDGATIIDNAGPLDFVNLIQHAACVCTDSFHATAIALNSSVDFIEFLRFSNDDENSQNSRIFGLLDHYGLQSRLYSSDYDDWMNRIDYENVQNILEDDRKKSWNYLINAIER